MSAKRRPNSLRRWTLILAGCLIAVTMAMSSLGTVSATPTLTLTPDRGLCASRVLIEGTGLPPGQTLGLTARANASDLLVEFATPTVGADGSFVIDVDMSRAIPGCLIQPPPAGTQYVIFLGTDPLVFKGARPGARLLATATFTVTAAASPATPPGLPNTGGGGTVAPWLLASLLGDAGLAGLLAYVVLCSVRGRRGGR